MTEKERLIFRILNLLQLLENTENQSQIRQIEGLLNELKNM